MKVNNLFLVSLLTVLVVSCNNRANTDDTKVVEEKEKAEQTAGSEQDFMQKGEKVYNRVCLVCHQSDGSGVPMMYPPVIESSYISGNTDSLIVLILEGMSGPVVVKGEQYNSIMPPQKDVLDDKEIADLINFLRNSYGNSGEPVNPEQVARMRK